MKEHVKNYSLMPPRNYSFSLDGLKDLLTLKKRSVELLIDLLSLVPRSTDPEDLYLSPSYVEAGFNDKSNYYKHKKELVEHGFLIEEGRGKLLIDFCRVDYLSRRQKESLRAHYNLNKNVKARIGSRN